MGFCYQGVLWAGVSFPGCGSLCLPAPALLSASCRWALPLCAPSLGMSLWARLGFLGFNFEWDGKHTQHSLCLLCLRRGAKFMLVFGSLEKEWTTLGVDMMELCCYMLFLSTKTLAFWVRIMLIYWYFYKSDHLCLEIKVKDSTFSSHVKRHCQTVFQPGQDCMAHIPRKPLGHLPQRSYWRNDSSVLSQMGGVWTENDAGSPMLTGISISRWWCWRKQRRIQNGLSEAKTMLSTKTSWCRLPLPPPPNICLQKISKILKQELGLPEWHHMNAFEIML